MARKLPGSARSDLTKGQNCGIGRGASGRLDDAGPMDAMGLGWIINMPVGNQPLVLQKSGGLQGSFAYLAIAPTHGAAVFFAVNEFSTAGFTAAVAASKWIAWQN